MPIRKIPKTYGSLSGVSVSHKLTRQIAFESSLERDLFALLEFDPNIVYYEEQPLRIEYLDSTQKLRSYTPDILVVYKNIETSPYGNTHILGEVKYRANLFSNWSELKPKFKAARKFCKRKNWLFNIFTENEIRTPYLKNVRFLLPYKNHVPNHEYCETLLDSLSHYESIEVSQLLDECSLIEAERLQIIPNIWYLIANEEIFADLNTPLTMKSQIWLEEAENE